jgi:hypothetical protein
MPLIEDEEGIAVSSVHPLQSSRVYSSEFDTQQSDGLSADGDASLGEKVFYISVAQVEAIVEPENLPHEVLWLPRRKLYLVGICAVCRYASANSINYSQLSWRYLPMAPANQLRRVEKGDAFWHCFWLLSIQELQPAAPIV